MPDGDSDDAYRDAKVRHVLDMTEFGRSEQADLADRPDHLAEHDRRLGLDDR